MTDGLIRSFMLERAMSIEPSARRWSPQHHRVAAVHPFVRAKERWRDLAVLAALSIFTTTQEKPR
jgi:hypothetical protein